MNSDAERMYVFFKAVQENDIETVDEMLQAHGFSPDARNGGERNETALHLVAYKGYEKLAQLLVDKYKADVNVINGYGEIPLEIAKDNYHAKICKFLINRNSNKADCAKGLLNTEEVDSLFEAAETNNIKKLCDLLDRGVDVNSVDNGDYSSTPLHIAAKYGHEELAKLLVDKYHADINRMDDIGDRPIHTAAQNDHMDIVKFLIERKSKDIEDVEHLMKKL